MLETIFEIIFEVILDVVVEGSIEVSKSSKIPKYVRYPLIGMILLFFSAVIGLILFTGVLVLDKSIFSGMLLISVGLLLLFLSIIKFRKTYLTKINKG